MALFAADTDGLLAIASAIPLLLLGSAVLGLRPTRADHLAFGAFAVAWSLQVATANLGRLALDADLVLALYRATLLLYLATALFLVHFARIHPHRPHWARGAAWGALLALLVLPGVAVLLVWPDAVVRVETFEGRVYPVYGVVTVPLFFAVFFGAFYYATAAQLHAARTAPTAIARSRARLVFLALALFVSYLATRNFLGFAFPGGHEEAQPLAVLVANALLYGGGLLLIVGLLVAVLAFPSRRGDIDLPMAAALGLPALVAIAERTVATLGVVVETGWLWRVALVALVAFAAARYRLFDVDVRHRGVALTALPFGIALLTLAVLVALVDTRPDGLVVGVVVGTGLVANAASWRFRRALAERFLLLGGQDEGYLQHRRLEVYRAALEETLATEEPVPARAKALNALRRRLGVSEREHEVLLYMVRRDFGRGPQPTQAPHDDRLEPGHTFRGRYRIDRLIGEGAHGRALLAHDTTSGQPIVLKVVGTDLLGGRAAIALLQEASVLSRLDHPNVVRIHAVAETRHAAVLVLEHCAQGDLGRTLSRRGALPLREAVHILDDILDGLDAAHSAGVVHRDLKPENVLLDAEGHAKLSDFGVARQLGPDATVIADAGPVGTLLYMSPEQVRGAGADARSDLYAAGVLFHQMITGRYYLRVAGRDDFQIRRQILETPPRLQLSDHPAWVTDLLRRALAKDPDARFPDARSMRDALHMAVPARAPTSSSAARPIATP